MKLKFKFMAILGALGIVSTGFAAWNFAQPTDGSASINVDIESYTALGTITVAPIGQYNLASTPNALAFTATYSEDGKGVPVSELNLTYTVILNEDLGALIDFGASATGSWVSGVETSITPVWKEGMNPTSSAAYQAIRDNLANLHMTVSFTATRKTGLEPVAPGFVAPAPLPAGFEADPSTGVIEYDQTKSPTLQLGVVGLTEEGGTQDGVTQNFNWTTSNVELATVDGTGLVTPLDNGNVTITATAATLSGKGLKKAEGAAKHEFKLHITGFAPVFVPVATSIELVLPEGIENGHEMIVGDKLNVSARVLDQNGDEMTGLEIEHELDSDETASYDGGVLTALAVEDEGMILFGYLTLDVSFEFTIVAPAPEIDHIEIQGTKPLVVLVGTTGQLTAKVIDNETNEMPGEEVIWTSSDSNIIAVTATGAYTAIAAGSTSIVATSKTNPAVTAPLSVTVNPLPVKHNVTLNYDNGTPNGSEEVVDGQSLAQPANPSKVGYKFVEWQLEGETYVFSTPVNSDITLIAVYTQIEYSVSFDLDGGTGDSTTQQVPHGEKATNPGTPTRDGYNFLGWFNGATEFDFENTSVMSALNLKAKWEIESYNVTFDTDGGSTIDSVPVEHNAKVTKPADPVKEGFTFDGWFVNEVSYDFNDAVTGDLTLKAKWVEDEGPQTEIVIPETTDGIDWKKVNSLADLTKGYYVFTSANHSSIAMATSNPGKYQNKFDLGVAANDTDLGLNTISTAEIVWKLKNTGPNTFTINSVKDGDQGYLSYTGSGNDVFYGETADSWSFAMSGTAFEVTNATNDSRMLKYNSGSPRFSCYTSAQTNVSLYKLDESTIRPFGNLTDIEIVAEPISKTFHVGDTFTSNGLKIKIFDDSVPPVTQILSEEYTTNFDGKVFTTDDIGTHNVTVTFTKNGVQRNDVYEIEVTDELITGTALYEITSKNTLTLSGKAPDGSSASIVESYSTSQQMTANNSQTVTLTNYAGVNINEITISMKSNASKGKGGLQYSLDGGTTWVTLVAAGTAFSNAAWAGKWSTTFIDIKKTVDISVTSNVIFKISATENSLYAASYQFKWSK